MNKQRLFSKLIHKWVGLTYAGWWKIDLYYLDNKAYAKAEHYTHNHAKHSVATCHSDWRYLEASINVNLSALKRMSRSEIEYTVVHELMHVFLNEMRENNVDHEERTATLLARSFILCNRKSSTQQ